MGRIWTRLLYNDGDRLHRPHEAVGQYPDLMKARLIYLLYESSSLEGALVATCIRPVTQGYLVWRALASQGSSRRVIMGVRFLMASAACPLVDFAIHLYLIRV